MKKKHPEGDQISNGRGDHAQVVSDSGGAQSEPCRDLLDREAFIVTKAEDRLFLMRQALQKYIYEGLEFIADDMHGKQHGRWQLDQLTINT